MSRQPHPPQPNITKLILGLFIIAAGVLLTIGRMRDLDLADYIHYWPVALMAVGVAQLAGARTRRRLLGAFVWLAAGAWQLAHNLGYLGPSLSDLFPLVFVLVGVSLVRRSRPAGARGADWLTGFVAMGGLGTTSSSKSFRGGDLTAVMGGCETDLRAAAMAGEGAVLEVFVLWGGVEVRVPEGWSVDMQVLAILGDAEDKTTPAAAGGPTGLLVVRGFAIMGGVEVKN